MHEWNIDDMPDLRGKRAVVTGGNSGIGYETVLGLVRHGAEVVLAARSAEKGEAAVTRIRQQVPDARVRLERLDLARLDSVADFSARLTADGRALDLLINNAGVMALPERQLTADGFEMQLGTNYLGHYALTARLLPLLSNAKAPRVVSLSSIAHKQGRIDFDDLQGERHYRAWKAYSQSKLVMLMFALELARRSERGEWGIGSLAAHPGVARTSLIENGPDTRHLLWRLNHLIMPLISHSAAAGALPTLYAATDAAAHSGGYYGPSGVLDLKGPTDTARTTARARNEAVAARLWEVSAQLTGVSFPDD